MTQEDLDILKQQNRELSVVIKLMNKDYQLLEEISGEVISYDFSIDSTSDIRRTCNVTLTPINSSFEVGVGNQIWIDKYIQIFVGIKNRQSGEFVAYPSNNRHVPTKPYYYYLPVCI